MHADKTAAKYSILLIGFTSVSVGGWDLPQGSYDKSDRLREDWLDRKENKTAPWHKVVFLSVISTSYGLLTVTVWHAAVAHGSQE